LYQVSNFGRVKSLTRLSKQNHLLPERFLKTNENDRYLRVDLWKDGKHKFYEVHRLVAAAFIANPENKPVVNHIDGDKHNNKVNNLEWCTVSENNKHAYNTGLAKQNKTPIKATNIKTGEIIYFDSQTEAGEILGCGKGHINDCLCGRQKTCKGYKFEYIKEEIWRPIKRYENLYEISNLGRVKNTKTNRFLKPRINSKKYAMVTLNKKQIYIHRLVAIAFLPNPENKPYINHLDCNPQNNCVDNIEWCTHKENMEYARNLGRMEKDKPVKATNLKTGEEFVFENTIGAAKQLNIDRRNLIKVLRGKLKQTKGYKFEYIKDPN